MSWLRIDDGFTEHRKVVGLSDAAFRIHIEGMCYASRQQSDGFVPSMMIHRWHPDDEEKSPDQVIRTELVDAGLWEEVEDGWVIHDFLEYNPSRADIAEKIARQKRAGKVRAQTAERQGGKFSSDSRQPPAGCTNQHAAGARHQPGGMGKGKGESSSLILLPESGRGSVRGDFDQLWDAYPRKVGKADALKAFRATADRPAIGVMLDAVAWQRQQPEWLKDGGRFVPHPATWIRARRWEDEPSDVPLMGDAAAHNLAVMAEMRRERERERG